MTITRQQFIDELCAARAADPLAYAEGNYAFAVARAEDVFGPDLRTKKGVEKWIGRYYAALDPAFMPGAKPLLLQVVETTGHILIVGDEVPPSKFFSALVNADISHDETEIGGGWNEPISKVVAITKEHK